jgi:hypothetical protein
MPGLNACIKTLVPASHDVARRLPSAFPPRRRPLHHSFRPASSPQNQEIPLTPPLPVLSRPTKSTEQGTHSPREPFRARS